MVFSSATFLFIMLPLFLLTTLLVRKTSAANVLLLIISLVFYAWGEPVYVLLMIGSVLCNYLLALPAQRAQAQPRLKKAMLWMSVLFNIGLLGVFKYAGFAVNLGGATAEDVKRLLREVSDKVFENSGIRLEPEVRIW